VGLLLEDEVVKGDTEESATLKKKVRDHAGYFVLNDLRKLEGDNLIRK